MRLRPRLLLLLCGTAALATVLALAFQAQSLRRDLEGAAQARLERAGRAANQLIESHLRSVTERYRAISGTPVFRATLEIRDADTLEHYARSLRQRQGAARILFVGEDGRVVTAVGPVEQDDAFLGVTKPGLVTDGENLYVVVPVALRTGPQRLGRLIAVEAIERATLQEWSVLCGAEILLGAESASSSPNIEASVRELKGLEIRVSLSLQAEQEALIHSHLLLLAGGAIAMLGALGMSMVVSGSLVRPIEQIRQAAEQIGRGDFSVQLTLKRKDEIGELAVAVNGMRIHLNEMMVSRDRAEAATVAKSNFLMNMSHEIRTPLTAILGFSDLLLSAGEIARAPQERLESLVAIRRNGQHLLELLNDILDLSKIEAGQLVVERIHFRPGAIVEDVLSLLAGRASERGLMLSSHYRTAIPQQIQGDPTRLKQILMNLIGNAIKFTEAGSITVDLELLPSEPEPKLRFFIRDTGIGLTEEQQSRLFQVFEQADNSTSRRYGGSGLGLAISKQLAALMGGTIWVESEFGQGSTFTLELSTGPLNGVPLVLAPEAAPALSSDSGAGTASRLSGYRLLLAEDSPDNQRLLLYILSKEGAEVSVAEDGQIAIELASEALAAGEPFDVILMDMQMPVIDGYEATQRLRAAGYSGPIVALTAHAMSEERQRCLDAGCDDFDTKPIDRQRLVEKILAYASSGKALES